MPCRVIGVFGIAVVDILFECVWPFVWVARHCDHYFAAVSVAAVDIDRHHHCELIALSLDLDI